MIRAFIKKHRLEIVIFALALLARLVLFSVNFAHSGNDLVATIHGDDGYYELSQGIINGHGFTWDAEPPYHPNPLRPPVWPYLIAFFAKTFGTYWAVLAFELILGSLIPVLAFYVASRLFGRRVGKWTALVMCFEPYLVLFSFILYTETSFIFFFLLSMLAFLRYVDRPTLRAAVWCGVFMGLATLIKPTIQFLPALLPIGLAIMWRKQIRAESRTVRKDYLKHLLAFLLVFGVIMAPWLYRNKAEFGVWGISAQPAFNLYVYLVPTVLSIDNHTDFKTELDRHLGPQGISANEITLANSDEYKAKAYPVLLEHKLALVKSGLTTLVAFFTHDGMLTVLGYSGIPVPPLAPGTSALSLLAHPAALASAVARYAASPAIVILIMRLFWVALTGFFIFGVWRFFKGLGRRPDAAFARVVAAAALCVILYFAATTAINGAGVNARFRMPVDAFIIGFALYGLFSLKRDNTRTI